MAFPKASFLTSANFISGNILEWKHSIVQYLNLVENNEALQDENIMLRESSMQSLYRNFQDSTMIVDSFYFQQYTYMKGEIINSSVTQRNNFFTLNIGKNQGVEEFMGVFSANGVVGIIHSVSDHFSVVKSVLTSDININVVIEPIGLVGLLKWNGKSPKIGNIAGISNDLKIPKGSRVYTRGGSGIFPKGLNVGVVDGVYPVEGEALWDIEIKYSEEYRTLQNIYVVKNLLLDEQRNLEKKIVDEP